MTPLELRSGQSKAPRSLVLFIFRRDLRLEDHKPLQDALDYAKENGATVLPMFIFSKSQVGNNAPVKSYRSIACLIQSLKVLNSLISQLRSSMQRPKLYLLLTL